MKQVPFTTALFLWLMTAALATAQSPVRPGDRIAFIGNTFADQLRVHGYLETLLLQHTRENPVSIRNLAWGGDMISARDRPTGFPTEESHLMAHKTDVIVACFGMGESFSGEAGLDDFKSQLRSLLMAHAGKKYNGESEVRLVLVSPIACEDLGKLTPGRDKRNRELSAYTAAMRELASAADVPFVDLFDASRYLMDEPVGPKLTNNGIHLNSYGYWAISHTFANQLLVGEHSPDQQKWLLRIDAAEPSSDARGVLISDLLTHESGLAFRVEEESVPSLRPPTDQPLPPQLGALRDTLVIVKLKPGTYRLTVDQDMVAIATAEAWAAGVPIDYTPSHKAAEAYHAVVNDKNLQFTYSWKALNQVHIVGERRTSPSGKSLPAEIVEFNRRANELDKSLSTGIELQTRQWRITRVEE